MSSSQPIVLDANSSLGSFVAGLLPENPVPNFTLPTIVRRPREWSVWLELLLVVCFGGMFSLVCSAAVVSLLKLPHTWFYGSVALLTFALLGGLAWQRQKLWDALCEEIVEVSQTQVRWTVINPWGLASDTIIPIQEFWGIRHECQTIRTRPQGRYTQELHMILLVHPDRARCIRLYTGETTRYMELAAQTWAKLLGLPLLEPNALAQARVPNPNAR
jgi:hypothetical protein